MRFIFVLFLILFLSGCGVDQGYNRGYIISHSQVEEQPQEKISEE